MSSSESRPGVGTLDLPPEQHRIWRALLAVTTRGLDHVDQQLQKRSNMTLTDYEILVALSRAENGRLRMSELAEEVHVSRSRLTYRVDRLTEVEFVVREECQDDRRGLWAILTETGRTSVVAATKGHHGDLRQLIFEHVGDDELPVLEAVLGRIVDKIDGH